jgi:hypothetical protein
MRVRNLISTAILAVLEYGVYGLCWGIYWVCWAVWHLPRGVAGLARRVYPPARDAVASGLITCGVAVVWLVLSIPDVARFLRDGPAVLRTLRGAWQTTTSYATATAAAVASLLVTVWQMLH